MCKMFKWIHHHVRCPTSLIVKRKKIRKRDKSDIGLSSSSLNTNTTNLKSNTTGNTNTQQPIKLKSKKNNSNETLSFNNLTSKNKNKNSSSFKDLNSEINFNNNENSRIKSSTLPLENSNNRNHLNHNSVSYSIDSNNTTISSYGSIANTTQTLPETAIIQTQFNEYHNRKSVVSDNLPTSHLIHQSECNMSTTATSTVNSKASSTLPQPSASSSSTSNSNTVNNKTSSTSYLDENNLKLAIIDYPDILKLIKLQNSIEYQEWLAFNTKMYFDQINVLYGAIVDACTLQSCPTMSAPLNNQFYWLDEKGKKFKYSASQYIDTVLTYIAKIISDESYFPTKCGHPFPVNFDSLVKKIHKHLFHILAHMYHSHYKELLLLKLNTYVNSIYLHFYSFNKSFNILDEKEIEIMDALNKSFLNKYSTTSTQQLANSLMQNQQQPPTIHQSASSSSGSTGFSFFKKKLNFNLMA